MNWNVWSPWIGFAFQLVTVTLQIFFTLRHRRKVMKDIDAEMAEAASLYSATFIAFGWHWGVTVERREWIARMVGMMERPDGR